MSDENVEIKTVQDLESRLKEILGNFRDKFQESDKEGYELLDHFIGNVFFVAKALTDTDEILTEERLKLGISDDKNNVQTPRKHM